MKNILIDISGKIDNSYIEPLIEIKNSAEGLNMQFFVIGAFARDIIMEYFHRIKAPRMTMDIDLGIRISNWNQFDSLITKLESSGKFKKTREKQRIIYKDKVIIDLVPFGNISNKDEKISWPPENEITMSVLGFNEIYNNSTIVRLKNNPPLELKIPTLPGLAVLKLLSWSDNYPDRSKDAEDLFFILINYEYTGIENKLYESELSILESEGFDNQAAGIILLGREMKIISSKKTVKCIREVLNNETSENSNYNLIRDISINSKISFDKILFLIEKLKKGFNN
ncbi:MAG: hypothetical protein FJW68_07135 [Actinobacteria bacterium]|nr:hypothetical protein [Actinomycetota bacterium]